MKSNIQLPSFVPFCLVAMAMFSMIMSSNIAIVEGSRNLMPTTPKDKKDYNNIPMGEVKIHDIHPLYHSPANPNTLDDSKIAVLPALKIIFERKPVKVVTVGSGIATIGTIGATVDRVLPPLSSVTEEQP